jgi:crotonobetainyl-CoA:carnitine CoA-transferase CaiB-like acyl-CoA transferase
MTDMPPGSPAPPTDPTAPLAGVRVLDLSRMFPGAYCTLMLADLGADVVKLEGPGAGDGLRFMGEEFPASHVALNRGKRSMSFNLKSPRAGEILRRLARDTDVIVESAKPGMMDKLGMGFDDLRAENPGLIWCSITGFGPDGPNVDAPGHDLTYVGYSGVLAQLMVGGEPSVPATPITLPFTGVMAALGIVAALQGRARTGVGSRVDANMVDSGIWMIAEQIARAANAPGPAWGSLAARANYRCADGKWVTCTASEPRSWAMVVEALELPELADYRMGTDEEATMARLAEVFATKPQAYWVEHPGMKGGIGPVYDAADLVDDPQVTHRHGLPQLTGDGPRVVANPLRIDRALGDEGSHALGAPPDLGEHTDAVLAAAGFDPNEIAALHEEQAV